MDLLENFTQITTIMQKMQSMGVLCLRDASTLYTNGKILNDYFIKLKEEEKLEKIKEEEEKLEKLKIEEEKLETIKKEKKEKEEEELAKIPIGYEQNDNFATIQELDDTQEDNFPTCTPAAPQNSTNFFPMFQSEFEDNFFYPYKMENERLA